MRRTILPFLFVLIAASVSGNTAQAALLYDNFPINGNSSVTVDDIPIGLGGQFAQPYDIGGLNAVSNEFFAYATGTATHILVGLWVNNGATPGSLSWALGTTAFGAELGSGTTGLLGTTALTFTNLGSAIPGITNKTIFEGSFYIPGEALTIGLTYYLTLSNALDSNAGSMAWDTGHYNTNSEIAYANDIGTPIDPQTFQINEETPPPPPPPAVPEPSSMVLLGMGAFGMMMGAYRRRRADGKLVA